MKTPKTCPSFLSKVGAVIIDRPKTIIVATTLALGSLFLSLSHSSPKEMEEKTKKGREIEMITEEKLDTTEMWPGTTNMKLMPSDNDETLPTKENTNEIIYTDEEAYKKAKEEYDTLYKGYSADIALYDKYNEETWEAYASFFRRDGFFYDDGFTSGFVNHILKQNKETIHIIAILYDGYKVGRRGTGLLYTRTIMPWSKINVEVSKYTNNGETIKKIVKTPELIKIFDLCIEQYKQLGLRVYGFVGVMGADIEANDDPTGTCILYIPRFVKPIEPKIPVFRTAEQMAENQTTELSELQKEKLEKVLIHKTQVKKSKFLQGK